MDIPVRRFLTHDCRTKLSNPLYLRQLPRRSGCAGHPAVNDCQNNVSLIERLLSIKKQGNRIAPTRILDGQRTTNLKGLEWRRGMVACNPTCREVP